MTNPLCHVQQENATVSVRNIEARHPLYSTIMANIVLNGFLCYTTIMTNTVTIYALKKTSSPEKPLKTLLLSLTISDFGVGLLGQPLYIVNLVEQLRCNVPNSTTAIVSAIVHNLLYLTSFGSIMAISINRYIAIEMPLRYQDLVTHKRVVITVSTIWLFSALFILCTVFVLPRNIAFVIFVIIELVCFIATTLFSCKLYLIMSRHKMEIRAQRQQVAQNDTMVNIERLRKSTQSMFWIYIVFWACYLPYIIIMIIETCLRQSIIIEALFMFSETIVLLNSSLNPIIYSWKMRHIRQAVMDIPRNIFRSFNGLDGR